MKLHSRSQGVLANRFNVGISIGCRMMIEEMKSGRKFIAVEHRYRCTQFRFKQLNHFLDSVRRILGSIVQISDDLLLPSSALSGHRSKMTAKIIHPRFIDLSLMQTLCQTGRGFHQ